MNNTFFRRKLGLGILIALVLAFGVHEHGRRGVDCKKTQRRFRSQTFGSETDRLSSLFL